MLLRAGGILFVALLALWLYCLLDAITAERSEVRLLPKQVWVVVLLLTLDIGAVLWLLLGRPQRTRPTDQQPVAWPGASEPGFGWPAPSAGPGSRQPNGPASSPDDDAEFLARLDRQLSKEHEQMLERWEAELRRREEELRQHEDGEDGEARPGAAR